MLTDAAIATIQSPGVVGTLHRPAGAASELLSGTSVAFTFTGTQRRDAGPPRAGRVHRGHRRRSGDDVAQVHRAAARHPADDHRRSRGGDPGAGRDDAARRAAERHRHQHPGRRRRRPAGDNLSIRGFSARTDFFIDGVRDVGGYSRDPFNVEQVEVVKGPSSSIAGRGSTGGVINMATQDAASWRHAKRVARRRLVGLQARHARHQSAARRTDGARSG